MTIQVSFPSCSKSYQVKDAAAGKKFQCKGCETVVVVPDGEASSGDSARSRSKSGSSPKRRSSSAGGSSESRRRKPSKSQPSSDARKAAAAKKKRRSSQAGSTSPRRSKGSKSAGASSSYDEYDYSDADYEDYGDYGEDDYEDSYASPSASRKSGKSNKSKSKSKSGNKKKKKSSSSGGGLAFGFNLNRLNAALCAGGVVLAFIGLQEARLSAKSKDTPTQMTLAELAQNGPGDNIYLTLTEIDYIDEETVVYGTDEGGGVISKYDKVWTPMFPAGGDRGAAIKAVLHSTNSRTDAAVQTLLSKRTHTGLIINDVDSFSSDERSLIQSGLRGGSVDDVYVFQAGRSPSGAGMVMLYFLGGGVLFLGGLAWILLVR